MREALLAGWVNRMPLRMGAHSALLTTGATLPLAVDAADLVRGWDVASLPLWNTECVQHTLPEWASKYDRVITVEDHLAAGGFGSFVREILPKANIRSVCLDPTVCGMVGTQAALNEAGGLSVDNLVQP